MQLIELQTCCCQVLQNLGKADRTTDTTFAQHVVNFADQQVTHCILMLQQS